MDYSDTRFDVICWTQRRVSPDRSAESSRIGRPVNGQRFCPRLADWAIAPTEQQPSVELPSTTPPHILLSHSFRLAPDWQWVIATCFIDGPCVNFLRSSWHWS